MTKYIIILFFVCSIYESKSQDTINSATVEQKSYQLYQDKNWSALINYGKKAIKNGYNYFYMQMRVGIAYYEKKNYSLAEGYFKKALTYNSTDDLALEYLYYCYLLNGRNEEARQLSKQFSKTLSEKIGTDKQSSLNFFMFEAGTKRSDSATYYDKVTKKSSNYFNSPIYFQLGLNHSIKNSFSLFHSFTYFNQQTFLGSISQPQYYLKAAIPIKNNWLISPSFHLVHIKSTKDVMFQAPNNNNNNMGNSPNHPPFNNTTITLSNYFVGSFMVQKTIKKIALGLGTVFSNMNNVTQYIHNGFASYSVFGNSKLVFGVSAYIHTIDNYSTNNLSLAPFLYIQPTKRISLKVTYLVNNKNNIIEDNGYLVNNSSDLTKYRYGALANFIVSKRLTLYALYQLEFKQENVQLFNYRYAVFVGGIKITP